MFRKSVKSKSLKNLADAVMKLADGDTSVTFELDHDGDIGRIAQGLSKIARNLGTMDNEIEKLITRLHEGEAKYRIDNNELRGVFAKILNNTDNIATDYELVIDTISSVFIMIDPKTFLIKHANEYARKLFANNASMSSIFERPLSGFLGADIRNHSVTVSSFNNEGVMQFGELQLVVNGKAMYFNYSCLYVEYGPGQPSVAGLVMSDVTETRNMYEEVAEKTKAERLAREQTQKMAKQLDGYVQRQAAAVSQSSASIEEMIANTDSVTKTLSKNAQNVKALEQASEEGHTGLNEVVADTQEIVRESESLLEINAVMANIASQTNLLSMNAAIEAAHAGDSGRGFAVVADEIRKLAESSSSQSKTISAALKKIKGSIDKITKSTGNVLNKFKAIDDGIKTVAEQENNILKAMEEQGQGSKEMLEAIGEVNKITLQVEDASRQLLEGKS